MSFSNTCINMTCSCVKYYQWLPIGSKMKHKTLSKLLMDHHANFFQCILDTWSFKCIMSAVDRTIWKIKYTNKCTWQYTGYSSHQNYRVKHFLFTIVSTGIFSFIFVYFIFCFFPNNIYILDYAWQKTEIPDSVCNSTKNEEGERDHKYQLFNCYLYK